MWVGPGEWRACGTGGRSENRLVSLVYVVCLVCLVELDEPDEQNKPDELVPPVSRGYPAGAFFCCAARLNASQAHLRTIDVLACQKNSSEAC